MSPSEITRKRETTELTELTEEKNGEQVDEGGETESPQAQPLRAGRA